MDRHRMSTVRLAQPRATKRSTAVIWNAQTQLLSVFSVDCVMHVTAHVARTSSLSRCKISTKQQSDKRAAASNNTNCDNADNVYGADIVTRPLHCSSFAEYRTAPTRHRLQARRLVSSTSTIDIYYYYHSALKSLIILPYHGEIQCYLPGDTGERAPP